MVALMLPVSNTMQKNGNAMLSTCTEETKGAKIWNNDTMFFNSVRQ